MKKFLILGLIPVLFCGCAKSGSGSQVCTDVSPESERPQIMAYCNANNISYTIDSSGIFYQIIDHGTDPRPTLNSNISTIYTGKYLNGNIIDSSSTPTQPMRLNQFIRGWQIALPLLGKGGRIRMVVPSSLCYGCYGVPLSGLPPNTIIYFDITLVDVQN